MEEVMLRRLKLICGEIEKINKQASNILVSVSLLESISTQEVEIIVHKLETVIKRFCDELTNYFRIAQEPAADDISSMSVIQLSAEENLAELKIKLNNKKVNISTREQSTTCVSGKLPKLCLAEFDGNILNWHQFWDQFSSNIHTRNLSDVDKLLYLKASLRGEAQKALDGLETTNKNYQIALSTLKERYGKHNLLIDSHYAALYKIKGADNNNEDCRKVLNDIEQHLRVLSSLGENINHNHLRFMIMEKFPENIIYELRSKTKADCISDIRKELENIISAKEDACRITRESNKDRPTTYTVETLHVSNEPVNDKNLPIREQHHGNLKFERNWRNPQKRNCSPVHIHERKRTKFTCIFCNENHYNDQCTNFKTIAQRKGKLENRCYGCLMKGHTLRTCRRQRKCQHCGQIGRHDRALCPKQDSYKVENAFHVKEKNSVSTILQTAVVQVRGKKQIGKCRLLLDSGSQRSYVTQNMARNLQLPVVEENKLAVFTFGAESPQEFDSPMVKLHIKTQTNKVLTIYANVVPTISKSVPYPDEELKSWKNKLQLADDGSLDDVVDILLGNDYYFSIMSMEKIKVGDNLYLVQSEFGWILSGKIDKKSSHDELMVITYFQSCTEIKFNQPDLPLDNANLKNLWDLESIGIIDSPKSNRDEEAINNFNETTDFFENRYRVSWPWKQYPPNLPSNFGLAYGRLVNLLKRTADISPYDQTINEQIKNGIIETVPKGSVDHPVHYLPFHGVQQPGKTIRIVYDASAKTNKDHKSLNECLYCGPMMLEDLTGLLLKFRCHPIGISADVEKAFLQIGLHERDRDVTRFLWLKDINKPATMENLLHLRFTRVPFGIISSPFLLNATIREHLYKSNEEQVKRIADNIYVDNVVTGTKTTEEALKMYKKAKTAFMDISMNLREWASNSEDFIKNIPDATEDKNVKILGLTWALEEDTLELRLKHINRLANTKREVLKVIASVYDPCGFSAPQMLPAKIFIQELWKQKIKWDTPFNDEFRNKWIQICSCLDEIKLLTVPRCYMTSDKGNVELHCFTDASLKAYAAVVYILDERMIKFVIGKSRLAPIKDQSELKVPRLELLGVLIGSRLIKYVVQTLQLHEVKQTLWTDSTIVIEWHKSNKLLPPFVQKRIDEIKQNKLLNIRHVPTELNPADVATKLNTKRDKWLTGPTFPLDTPDSTFSLLARDGLAKELTATPEIPMKANLDENQEKHVPSEKVTGISGEEAVKEEIKRLQAEFFCDEVNGRDTDLSRNLGLFKDDDGILRCKGRLKYADWAYDKRYPTLIPKDCIFTNNLIMTIHEKNYHVGANHTLSIIRQNYWIPQGKSQVQRIIRKCPRCIKHGGGPYPLPPTPALPPERVNYTSPFTFTGLDYLGPVQVKLQNTTEKRWICLFTCLAVRAIHLEVVKDSSAEEGLLALRRMIATRGTPTLITSDNATQFKLISEILTKPYCIENNIRWKFIPQLAPWFGGFYERLIGIVKNCMKRTLGKHLLNDSQLSTITKEIENVVNSRPLTCVDSELEHILKPSDFLTLSNCIPVKTSHEDLTIEGTVTKTDLIAGWRKALIVLDEFKDMFVNRYLPSLRERYSNSHQEPRVKTKLLPSIGQLVQIKGESKNREGWKVGKITALVKSSDGLCRVAKVNVNGKEFTRSIAHLYPLEVEANTTDFYWATSDTDHSHTTEMDIDTPLLEIETTPEAHDINTQIENLSDTPLLEIVPPETHEHVTETENLTDGSLMETETSTDITNPRKRRDAASRALERIREWTRNLLTLLK
ncbi:uncharacterized protein LOC126381584 [Pectinophora gossypiella]|uniref:uncharacterized protein LOC126381584 n=1 Tax=Pectinophora gossypiella TaxID=13191 RepID=UPI00214EB2BE|nr:uncharacterized protein LOC126381584 [Pectinophora gossypiella]XP_049887001.1 uncharacterized protein LOC126381584 [Pectinophora gossypiella]XP_049887002.1 uncharacterized protein LOC126381584 [Pectinophora gossypiella]XP_049887003.1 uncharacterized protein LOC126381584 [Pectinophora gossypiella]